MNQIENDEMPQCSLLAVQNTRSYSEKHQSPCQKTSPVTFPVAAVVFSFFLMQRKRSIYSSLTFHYHAGAAT